MRGMGGGVSVGPLPCENQISSLLTVKLPKKMSLTPPPSPRQHASSISLGTPLPGNKNSYNG